METPNYRSVRTGTPEEQLLKALFDGLTDEEAKYLKWLIDRVNTGKYTPFEARERFKKRFPNSKWLPENR